MIARAEPSPPVHPRTTPRHDHGSDARGRVCPLKPGVAQAAHTEATPGKDAIASIHQQSVEASRPIHKVRPPVPAVLVLPSGTPSWITPELVAHTLRVWQPRYAQQLGIDDAIDIVRSVARLSDALTSIRLS